MTLIKRNEDLFPSVWNDFFDNDWSGSLGTRLTGPSSPAVNIKDTAESYEIEVAAPGMKKENFSVNLDNSVLTISSEAHSLNGDMDKAGNYTRREFNYHSFRRAFTLPESVASENISAQYRDGVLYISIPKKEEAKLKPVRMIEIA